MIKITKTCAVTFEKARNSFFDVERNMPIGKKKQNKNKDGEKLFFKALDNRFRVTSKIYSWFNKVVPGQLSIKRTS